jgi:hypothetical protein
MDFFRRRLLPPASKLKEADKGEVGELGGVLDPESSPDLLLICSALLSKNVLNSFGANSGCNRAGTQKSLDESSSLEVDDGALGIPAALICGRSGSSAAPTLIDILLSACKLLNS